MEMAVEAGLCPTNMSASLHKQTHYWRKKNLNESSVESTMCPNISGFWSLRNIVSSIQNLKPGLLFWISPLKEGYTSLPI